MERIIPSEETQEAFGTLSDLYTRATKGELANPGEAITYVKKHPDGHRISLFSHNWRLYARVTENDGTERGFGIHREGLRDVSLVDSAGERTEIRVQNLDEANRKRFQDLSTVLVPWVVGRYLGGNEQSLPDGVQEYFSELSTSQMATDILSSFGNTHRDQILDNIEERTGERDEALADTVELMFLKERLPEDQHEAAERMQRENPEGFRERLVMIRLYDAVHSAND